MNTADVVTNAPARVDARSAKTLLTDWRSHIPSLPQVVQLVALLILIGWYVSAIGEGAVDLDVPGHVFSLEPSAKMMLDPDRTLTIDDIVSPAGRVRFQREARSYETVGSTRDVIWVKLDLSSLAPAATRAAGRRTWYLEFNRAALDVGELYFVTHSEGARPVITKYVADVTVPIEARDVPHVNSVFDVAFDLGHPPEAWLRIANQVPVFGAITLWDPSMFYKKVAAEETVYGIFYGGVLILLLYNLCIYFSMRQSIYVYYLGYLFCASFGLCCSDGHLIALLNVQGWATLKQIVPNPWRAV